MKSNSQIWLTVDKFRSVLPDGYKLVHVPNAVILGQYKSTQTVCDMELIKLRTKGPKRHGWRAVGHFYSKNGRVRTFPVDLYDKTLLKTFMEIANKLGVLVITHN
jgi:hypothetical protein